MQTETWHEFEVLIESEKKDPFDLITEMGSFSSPTIHHTRLTETETESYHTTWLFWRKIRFHCHILTIVSNINIDVLTEHRGMAHNVELWLGIMILKQWYS